MSEVINIKNRPVFLRWTFANVWIRGEELELATCDETGQPMVIHWKSGRAWFGGRRPRETGAGGVPSIGLPLPSIAHRPPSLFGRRRTRRTRRAHRRDGRYV